MPGSEMVAPLRTLKSSGFWGSPKLRPDHPFQTPDLPDDADVQIIQDVLVAQQGFNPAEDLGGQNKARGHGEPHGSQFLEKISLVAEADLVVELFVAPVQGGDGRFRFIGHDQGQNLLVLLKFFQFGLKGAAGSG